MKAVIRSSCHRTSRVEESAFELETRRWDVEAELVDAESNYWHQANGHTRPADPVCKLLQLNKRNVYRLATETTENSETHTTIPFLPAIQLHPAETREIAIRRSPPPLSAFGRRIRYVK